MPQNEQNGNEGGEGDNLQGQAERVDGRQLPARRKGVNLQRHFFQTGKVWIFFIFIIIRLE
jgi:hypothetical protein